MAIKDIAIGWGRWLGVVNVTDEVRQESERRLTICDACEFGKPSEFLELINGSTHKVDAKFCTKCHCPCHQKSLTEDVCPEGKWNKI